MVTGGGGREGGDQIPRRGAAEARESAAEAEAVLLVLFATFYPCLLVAARGAHDGPRPWWLPADLSHTEGGGARARDTCHTRIF